MFTLIKFIMEKRFGTHRPIPLSEKDQVGVTFTSTLWKQFILKGEIWASPTAIHPVGKTSGPVYFFENIREDIVFSSPKAEISIAVFTASGVVEKLLANASSEILPFKWVSIILT